MRGRHQFRAEWHDYNGGIYFVTICCVQKQHLFGEIVCDITDEPRHIASTTVGTRFIASTIGEIVEDSIKNIQTYYNDVEIWNHVVMPNHIHLVIAIQDQTIATTSDENTNIGCLRPKRHQAHQTQDFHHNSRLASVVGAFKAGVTRQVRTRRIASVPDGKIWQARYYEHIIRSQRAYDNIMNYIDMNIENWRYDKFNVHRIDKPVSPSASNELIGEQ